MYAVLSLRFASRVFGLGGVCLAFRVSLLYSFPCAIQGLLVAGPTWGCRASRAHAQISSLDTRLRRLSHTLQWGSWPVSGTQHQQSRHVQILSREDSVRWTGVWRDDRCRSRPSDVYAGVPCFDSPHKTRIRRSRRCRDRAFFIKLWSSASFHPVAFLGHS